MRAKRQPRHGGLADLAGRQHGVVSIRQLLGPLGYSASAVARAAADGRLLRLYRGVYAVGHTDLSPQGRCLAAVLACAPDAVLSHVSAAWLWGLLRYRPGAIHLSSLASRHPRPPLSVHRARLATQDRAVREGIPVTAVPRTLLDLAAMLPERGLAGVVERGEELRLLDLRGIDELLGRVGGHRGAKRLRDALQLYRPSPYTRSGLERRFLELVREAGLPPPATGYNVAGYELDVYWEPERFVVELDVYETHGSRAAFERDRERQEELKLIGVEMVRVTGPRLAREPGVVIERVRELLRRRRG